MTKERPVDFLSFLFAYRAVVDKINVLRGWLAKMNRVAGTIPPPPPSVPRAAFMDYFHVTAALFFATDLHYLRNAEMKETKDPLHVRECLYLQLETAASYVASRNEYYLNLIV